MRYKSVMGYRGDRLFHKSCLYLSSIQAEGESDSDEEKEVTADKETRDSGCFESSENLACARENPKTEAKILPEATEEREESAARAEAGEEAEQMGGVQQMLQDLTVR